jgi:hypothetical protein
MKDGTWPSLVAQAKLTVVSGIALPALLSYAAWNGRLLPAKGSRLRAT